MEHAGAVRFDEPGDLRIPGAVDRGHRRDRERSDPGGVPGLEPAALEPGGVELALGLGEGELFEALAAAGGGFEHGRPGGQAGGEGPGIGVVAVKVGNEPRGRGRPLRPDDLGGDDRVRFLAEGPEDGAGVGERVDQEGLVAGAELESRPAERSDPQAHRRHNSERASAMSPGLAHVGAGGPTLRSGHRARPVRVAESRRSTRPKLGSAFLEEVALTPCTESPTIGRGSCA